MSAPKTNMETEKRRHRGPLIGMIAVVAFALSLLFFLLMGTADEGTPVDSEEGSVDGRNGRAVKEAPGDPTVTDPAAGPQPITRPPAPPAPAPPAPATQP